jgi:imidazole glycerol-phosphate synthase subunit HisH
MSAVAIVDYGMCNLDSMARAIEECGGKPIVTDHPEGLQGATHIILPGVGAFGDAMDHLEERNFRDALATQVLENRIPFLGVCLGMQLLAATGYESGKRAGLGWIPGEVVKLTPTDKDTRIPHIGWNSVFANGDSGLFTDIPAGTDFYFVHSFHLKCDVEANVLATTPYAGRFVSAVHRDNIYGVQFHPEKSQKPGFKLLKNFLALSN